MCHYYWIVVPPGFTDVDSPTFGGGAFYQGASRDGVHIPVLAEGDACVLVCGLGLPLHSNL